MMTVVLTLLAVTKKADKPEMAIQGPPHRAKEPV
jgi:hypothetical protein